MAGVYTTRFLAVRGAGPAYYTCPVGHRAVVKAMNVVNHTAAAVNAGCNVGSVYVWVVSLQASQQASVGGLYVVLYAGDVLTYSASASDVSFIAAGYLFADPGGARAGEGPQVQPALEVVA